MSHRKTFLFATLLLLVSTGTMAQEATLPSTAIEALRAVYSEKASRTPAQAKLDTALVGQVRSMRKGSTEFPKFALTWTLKKDSLNRIEVDVLGDVSPADVEQLGGSVISHFPQYKQLRAFVPVESLEPIASLPGVRHIRHASQPSFNQINVSQGDVAHRANLARSQFGVNGSGVKVGVLSNSVEALASLQASGDLPFVTVLPGQAGSGTSEGTAMLEIVHDLAPGAQLYFATANGGVAAFANNIIALKNQGCKVIVDDSDYTNEGAFQDDIVSQAVEDVAASGIAYFSPAGNSGNLSTGNSGVWEGNFSSGGTFGPNTIHSFGSGVVGNQVTVSAPDSESTVLQWSDPWGTASNDYDLCVFSSDLATLLVCSTEIQNGAGFPFEAVPAPPAGTRLVIINTNGNQQPRFLHLNTNRGRLQLGTSGQIHGHSAAAGAFSIAAVSVARASGGVFVGGGVNPVESFSSDGPRRVFFTPTGVPLTPGNFLATGGVLRQKPDFAAADGVATATTPAYRFNPFFGTSAAAPHAAAIAALMFSANPSLSLSGLRSALIATSLDNMAPGVDRDSGYGIINAQAATAAVSIVGNTSPCVRDAATACLQGDRFEVKIAWQNTQGSGIGQLMSFGGQRTENNEAGFFYFQSATNFEMGVKVLNACVPDFGNKYWVFISGLTDQGWAVTVRDTHTGAVKNYNNVVGHLSTTFADTAAFDCN